MCPSSDPVTATAAYVTAPYAVEFRHVPLRPVGPHDVLLDVLATGICGYDMEIAGHLAAEPRPFGHETCCRVREIGSCVSHVAVGDTVVLESSAFCGDCAVCRNGRVDLCRNLLGIGAEPVQAFADALVAPARVVVPAVGLHPTVAALAEPCGVAVDMIRLAEIGMTDRVLVVGAGPIGLMALAMARKATCGEVVAVDSNPGRLAIASQLGADAVYRRSEAPLPEIGRRHGGFHALLVSAPPSSLPGAIAAAAYEGRVVFIGFDWGEGGKVTIDTTAMHLGKVQLRPSFASPALFLPMALDLLRAGVVPGETIISHRFPLSRLGDALRTVASERDTTRKAMVIPDARFAELAGEGATE